jgi:uncharacterized membrane protein
MNKIGPVEYAILAFPNTKIGPTMLPPLRDLVQRKLVRIIDLIVVQKDAAGNVRSFELGQLPPDEASVFHGLEAEVLDLFNEEDIAMAAQDLEPNTTAAMIVWENTWAAEFMAAVRSAGGQVVTNDRIPSQIVQDALNASTTISKA